MKTLSAWPDLKATWSSLPGPIRIYLGCYFFILFLCVFWVPGNDYDTLTSYITRIKLEEFGDLHQTATLELQYLFPKFFDYLHKPLLELGYFTTLPSFVLFFAGCLVLFLPLTHRERLVCAVFIMACPPVLVATTSFKNDLPLACFGLLAWYAIFIRSRSSSYLPFALLALAALAGTKWHGFFLIAPLGIGLIYQLTRTRKPDIRALVITLLMLPAYWLVSSASVYFDNWARYGSPMPVPQWVGGQTAGVSHLPINIYRFVSSTFLDTFDVPFCWIDYRIHWKIWPILQHITLDSKEWTYAVVLNSQHSNTFGVALLVVLACAILCLFRRTEPLAVRAAAATSLFYTIMVTTFVDFHTGTNRYYISSFMLGLIPAARVLARVKVSRTGVMLVLAYAFAMSMQALLLDQERLLVPVVRSTPEYNGRLVPMYHDLLNRDRLYFNSWSGYVNIYDEFQKDIQRSDGMVFYNMAAAGEVPFLYPFIKDRSPANTRIINARNGGQWDPGLCQDFRYVMTYRGKLEDPHYELIYAYSGTRDMSIYRRVKKGCS